MGSVSAVAVVNATGGDSDDSNTTSRSAAVALVVSEVAAIVGTIGIEIEVAVESGVISAQDDSMVDLM